MFKSIISCRLMLHKCSTTSLKREQMTLTLVCSIVSSLFHTESINYHLKYPDVRTKSLFKVSFYWQVIQIWQWVDVTLWDLHASSLDPLQIVYVTLITLNGVVSSFAVLPSCLIMARSFGKYRHTYTKYDIKCCYHPTLLNTNFLLFDNQC